MQLILDLCTRHGWTLDQYFALPAHEQIIWEAHEYHRQQAVEQAIQDAFEASERMDDNGNLSPRAEIASTVLLSVLARLLG